ncbi:MAG: murein biosynthesis integral membrane protein MurJ [bacterium]
MVRSTAVVSSATMLSRVFGFVRDMVIAYLFGAGMGADAFFVAFRVPNLLRRLFGEGALSAAFIPVFSETLTDRGEEDAFRLSSATFNVTALVLIFLCLLAEVYTPFIVRCIAPGFTDTAAKYSLTVSLTRITIPYLLFISMVAVSMGVLNSLGHFAAPALAPVLLNISLITSALTLYHVFDHPATALAVGVLAGGISQFLFQLPFLIKKGVRYFFTFSHPALKQITTLMIPGILGLAVAEINILVDTLLASLLPQGSVSYLYYGNRVVQLPLGVFATALGTVILPMLSKQAAAEEEEKLKETFSLALRLVFFISIPAMAALLVLSRPVVTLLFQHGRFDSFIAIQTATALSFYAVGLFAYSGVKVMVPVFYAFKDTKTPVKIAVFCLILNIGLNLLLMGPLKHGGLALATALSSIVNLALLGIVLNRRLTGIAWNDIMKSLGRVLAGAGLLAGMCRFLLIYFRFYSQSKTGQALTMLAIVGSGITVYWVITSWMGSEETRYLKRSFKTRGCLEE